LSLSLEEGFWVNDFEVIEQELSRGMKGKIYSSRSALSPDMQRLLLDEAELDMKPSE
jgi:hypothetical protein